MRAMSQMARDWLSQPIGVQPINIIALYSRLGLDTADRWYYFADTNRYSGEVGGVNPFTGQPIPPGMSGDPDAFLLGVDGVILEISSFENIVTNRGSSSGQLHVVLDDTSKIFYRGAQLNNRPCKLIQWFKHLPLSDAFTVFDGRVNTPIEYHADNLTMAFDIVSWLEDREVGFSIDEGDFDYIPPRLVGRNWPLVFGTAFKVPALQLNDIPKGVVSQTYTKDQIVSAPVGVDHNAAQSNNRAMEEASKNAFSCFRAANNLRLVSPIIDDNVYTFAVRNSNDPLVIGLPPSTDSNRARIDREKQIKDLYDQGNRYLIEAQKAGMAATGGGTTPTGGGSQHIQLANGSQFPQGSGVAFATPSGHVVTGVVQGDQLVVGNVNIGDIIVAAASRVALEKRDTATEYQQVVESSKLFVIPGGAAISIQAGLPVEYIACLMQCQITGVWAKRRFGEGESVLWPVPSNYYSIVPVTYGTPTVPDYGLSDQHIHATKIIMPVPLSSRTDVTGTSEGWDGDDIYCDIISPVGPHICDVLTFLIGIYTIGNADPASFAFCRPLLDPYPVNFAILERRNVLDVISDIAYQSRCALWAKDDLFYLKYLSINYPVVDTITESDIEAGTLQIDLTPSSDKLVTKLIVDFDVDYGGERPGGNSGYRKSYKLNAKKYGTHVQQDKYFIYNDEGLVQKSAIFWLNRQANQFKRMTFNTFLHKLPLEAYDYVQVTHPVIADGPVVCMVESCVLDTASNKVTMKIWTPVRAGERAAYQFAMPATLPPNTVYGAAILRRTATGTVPGQGGSVFPPAGSEDVGSGTRVSGNTFTTGSPASLGLPPTNRPFQDAGANLLQGGGIVPQRFNIGPSDVGNQRPPSPTFLAPGSIVAGVPSTFGAQRNVQVFEVKPITPVTTYTDIPGAYPGIVLSGAGQEYTIQMYSFGKSEKTATVKASPFFVLPDIDIQPQTVCTVYRLIDTKGKASYTFQPSTWSGPPLPP